VSINIISRFNLLETKTINKNKITKTVIKNADSNNRGDIVKVTGIDSIIDMYGMLMKIEKRRKTFYCPLAELSVVDKKSKNYKLLYAYEEWEENE